jgi:hypothetical protein
VHLLDGRAKAAERYPVKLVKEILKGMKEQLGIGKGLHSLDVGVAIEEPEVIDENLEDTREFYDGIMGEALDPELVDKGRMDEMGYMENLGVFVRVKTEECFEKTGRRPLPSGWVDTNKGDRNKPEIRCRLVAKETKRRRSRRHLLSKVFGYFSVWP